MKRVAFCGQCNVEYSFDDRTSRGRFCSAKCHGLFRFLTDTLPRFEKGEIKTPAVLYKVLVHLRGAVCAICSLGDSWCGLFLKHQVDHIDGNADNNLPENVRLLCPLCHTQTVTFSRRGGRRVTHSRSEYRQGWRKRQGVSEK